MSALMSKPVDAGIVYPESDGMPMADNTKQYEWIVTIKGGLDAVLPNDFVAGDLLWYPVEGEPKIRQAPDVMVVLGRAKGHRGSYRQWEEGNIVPQVVFEIWSPGNTLRDFIRKQNFYDQYGVAEFYLYDPDKHHFSVWVREGDHLVNQGDVQNWVSPKLGIRFEFTDESFAVFRPDGKRFETFAELQSRAETETQRAEAEAQRAEAATAEAERNRLENERLKQKLKELGVDVAAL